MNIATRRPHDNKEWPGYNRDYQDRPPGGSYPCLSVAGFSVRIFTMLWFGAALGAAFRLGIAQVVGIKIL
jgi:hypothetical protein